MKRVLYVMSYSAWSERARFALLHHACEYEEREYKPLLGELALRVRAKRLFGNVSVPMLRDGPVAVMGSLPIAEYSDQIGSGTKLFPPDRRAEIQTFNERLEPMFQAVRARVLRLSQNDAEAAADLVPPEMQRLPIAAAMGRFGAKYVAWKHPTPKEGVETLLRDGLRLVQTTLGGRDYVYGTFSYADILAASAVQQVAPPAERFVALGPVKRRTWSDPILAAEFADLVAWRDELYEKHRPIR